MVMVVKYCKHVMLISMVQVADMIKVVMIVNGIMVYVPT